MKKIYNAPSLEIVIIKTAGMIATSNPDIIVNNDSNVSVDADKVESRQYDIWDD